MAKRDPIIDPTTIDWSTIVADKAAIEDVIPHRYEFSLLDAICHIDWEPPLICGWRNVPEEEFWVRGHIPGHPLFPGVLMVECTAQLCSYHYLQQSDPGTFFAFAGNENVRFRGQVAPGDRLLLAGKGIRVGRRQGIYDVEAYVGDTRVMSGRMMGMPTHL